MVNSIFFWGFSPIKAKHINISFSWGDHIRIDEGKNAMPEVYFECADTHVHICTLSISPHDSQYLSFDDIYAKFRERIQTHIDELFCRAQPVPTKIYRKNS